jgi:competence protein ComEA
MNDCTPKAMKPIDAKTVEACLDPTTDCEFRVRAGHSPLERDLGTFEGKPRGAFKRWPPSFVLRLCALLATAPALYAATTTQLPDGPGKQVTIRICGTCHSPERAASLHQTRRQWEATISKMVSMGATGTDDELTAVLQYLAKNFPPAPVKPIDINTASAIDMESSLLLLRSEATAVIQYRTEHGDFKSLDDLRKVPGLDFQKIEKNKARIVF